MSLPDDRRDRARADRPRILDALGDELVRAARAQEAALGAAGRRSERRHGVPRALVLGLALLLLAAAVAIGTSLVIGRGDPLPQPPAGAVPRELQPVPGSAHLAGLDVADPDGGPPWDVRTSGSRTGAVCVTVGQVLDGELGIVGLDRRFRALPAGAADTCSTPQRHGATLAGARGFRGGNGFTELTVVNGVAAAQVHAAEIVAGGRRTKLRLASNGAFLALFRGLPDTIRPRLILTEASGRQTTLRFADTGEYLAPDPSGGTPWTLTTQTARVRGLRCVGARRERGPDSPEPLAPDAHAFNISASATPVRCGRRDTAFVIARRFVPVASPRLGTVDPWGLNPARTVVVGAVPHAGARILLDGPGIGRRTVRVDPRTHGFLAVFDGHVDPRHLRIRLEGRRLRSMAGAVGLRGQPLVPVGSPPAWHSVGSVVRRMSIPEAFIRSPRTVRLARRATDPTGGPPWALRVWSAVMDPRLSPPGDDRRLLCFAAGIPRQGALTVPRPAAPPRRLELAEEGDSACLSQRWLESHSPGPQVTIYADDAASADPRPARVVVAGLLGDGVRAASLVGAGRPRRLALGPHGTYLLVLGPEAAAGPLRVRQVRDDGSTRTSMAPPTTVRCPVPATRTARVADPGGGAPWMLGRGRTKTMSCFFLARVVRGRPAWVDEASGVMHFGEVLGGGGATGVVHGVRIPPVGIEVQAQPVGRGAPSGPPSATQSARRALAGRTIVLGRATAQVVSVTLRTPRDIRTVTPVGGSFLAVYDGAFYGGAVIATARLRDGRTFTAHVPASSRW